MLSVFSGSNDAVLLLCVGISIGLMPSFVANQSELNKAKAELKQTENLEKDLEDELKTKDSLTVNDDDLHNGEKHCDEKIAESSESIGKIEAELEAELERLEINMKSSNIEIKLSDDLEVSFIHFIYALCFALLSLNHRLILVDYFCSFEVILLH